jgi:hypothetical protein
MGASAEDDTLQRKPWQEWAVPAPPSDDAVIWRYMDFAKFVAMLQTESLFFNRADKFRDPLEGRFPMGGFGSGPTSTAGTSASMNPWRCGIATQATGRQVRAA